MTLQKLHTIYPHSLAVGFIVFWSFLAINPLMRSVWLAENLPVVGVFLLLVGTFKVFRFSNRSYTLMSIWLILHTIGGHFTFAEVPFDYFTELFDFERNHFDRIAHFSIGLYAYPLAELVTRKGLASPLITYLFSLFAIMALAAGYEIIEWWYAVIVGGDAGIEFLGSQGDVWDAQKDMFADTLGAIAALLLFHKTQNRA